MAETVVEYQISADIEAVKRAMAQTEEAAKRLGDSIARELSRGGSKAADSLNRELDAGMGRAEGNASRSGSKIGTALARGIAAGLVAGAFAYLKDLQDKLLEIGDLAKKTGLSVERISALQRTGFLSGVSEDTVNKGLGDLGSKANKEFREGEGDLKELLEANNLKLTDRNGKLKDTNTLLENAATLIQNAKTEFDKVDIAKIFGLSEDWVKVLEKGPEALRESIRAAEDAGTAIDANTVKKAEDFDKAWREGWVNFQTNAKAAISDVAGAIGGLIAQAAALGNAIRSAQLGTLNTELTNVETRLRDSGLSPLQRSGLQAQREALLAKRGGLQGLDQLRNDAVPFIPLPADPGAARAAALELENRRKNGTAIPHNKGSGGGGSSGLSDADRAENRLEKYTEQLQRQGEVLKAEIDTFGQSNAERKAAVEIAKAQVDLQKVDEDTRTRLTEAITAQVKINEEYRTTLERQKDAMSAARSVGQELSDALGDIVLDGKSASDAMKNLLKSFARQALNAAFAGSGAFAGLFGTKESGGIFGSLFKGLFGGISKQAGGGELPRGFTMVGENGPELLRNNGSGVARVYPHGGGSSGMSGGGGSIVINADFRGASDSAVAQIRAQLNAMQQNLPKQISAANRRQQVRGYA